MLPKRRHVLLSGRLLIPLNDVIFDHVDDAIYAGFWCHLVPAFLSEVCRSRAEGQVGAI